MRTFSFVTVDVFTDRRFGGNPLAVFPDATGLSDGEMQSLAAEFNLSETTFVVPPENPANTARVRIFNRTSEMPFARSSISISSRNRALLCGRTTSRPRRRRNGKSGERNCGRTCLPLGAEFVE